MPGLLDIQRQISVVDLQRQRRHHRLKLLHWHAHIYALVTDGAFAPDGTFIALTEVDSEPFEKLWQRKVFDSLLKEE